MTLFRKVFQNQSQPAPEGEAPSEEAMRDAFSAVERGADPFQLDPFEHAVPDEEDADAMSADFEYDAGDRSEADALHPETADEIDPTDAEVAELIETLNPSDDLDAEEEQVVDTAEISKGPETDEEIAAFMNRALSDAPSEDEDSINDSAEDTEDPSDFDPVDELEFKSTDAVKDADAERLEEPDLPEENDLSSEGPVEEIEEGEIEPAATPNSVAEFAQAQMAGMAQANPEMDDGPDLPSPDNSEGATPALDLSGGVGLDAVPGPAAGRAGRRAGRVKTRLLGFNHGADDSSDPLGQVAENTATPQREKFPVGWLVVVEGPGMGHAFSIFTGASIIGRGEDQMIRLDFGDNSISRHNHAAIAYDEEANKFYVGHGGKSNIIRRNARPVLSTEELHHADLLRIGETTLRFVALCGSDFQWNQAGDIDAADV